MARILNFPQTFASQFGVSLVDEELASAMFGRWARLRRSYPGTLPIGVSEGTVHGITHRLASPLASRKWLVHMTSRCKVRLAKISDQLPALS